MRVVCPVLAMLAFVPGVLAQSLDNWNYASLQDDSSVSQLLDRGVVSMTDQPIGKVRNVMLDRDGNFEAMSVEFDNVGGDALALAVFEWSDVAVQPESNEVTVSLGVSTVPAAVSDPIGTDGVSVRRVIGMPVRLQGEEFGQVDDILFDEGADRPSAIIVETQGGERYALPPPRHPLAPASRSLDYDLAVRAVRELGEFEFSQEAR